MKLFLFMAMLTVFLVPALVTAETEYAQIGGTDHDFNQGAGAFRPTNPLTTVRTAGLTDGQNTPVVGDLNGDGSNEIVMVTGSTLRIYENTTLDILETLTISSADYAPITLFDINSDGNQEILLMSETLGANNLSVYDFDTGDLLVINSDSTLLSDSSVTGEVEAVISCASGDGGDPRCFLLAVDSNGGGTSVVYGTGFNSTHFGTTSIIQLIGASSAQNVCLSRVRSMTVANYDSDARDEFIFNYVHGTDGADEEMRILYVDVADDLTFNTELTITVTGNDPFETTTGDGKCSDTDDGTGVTLGDTFTSPLIGDFDQGGTLETVVGMMVDDDEFRLTMYDSGGNQIKEHPDAAFFFSAEADGQIIGNLMQFDVFGDNVGQGLDYCAMSLHNTDDELGLFCGTFDTSRTQGGLANLFADKYSIEFFFNRGGLFNLSQDYDVVNTISHASENVENSVNYGTDFHNTPELVNTYGVFTLTNTEVANVGDWSKFELERSFALTQDRACIMADYEKNTASDLICSVDNQLTYIDDSVQKGVPAIAGDITLAPCFDGGLIGVNTTFQTDFTVVDQNDEPLDQDLVNSRVILYYGTDNAQNSTDVINKTSGQIHTHLFLNPPGGLNQTGSVAVRYEVWDADNVDDPEIRTEFGVVGLAGVQFGDCVQTISIVPEDEEEEILESLLVDEDDNAIVTGFSTLGGTVGLGLTTFALFLLFIISISVFWFGVSNGVSGNAVLGLVAILNVFGLFIGARLGFFGTGFIVVISVIGVVIVGVFLGKFITGVGSGGE